MDSIDALLSGASSLGTLKWGPTPGGTTVDTTLYRAAAGLLSTDGTFRAGSGGNAFRAVTGAGSRSFDSYLLVGDVNPAFYIAGDGAHRWGAGGASVVDVNLYRVSSGTLKTDNSLVVGSSQQIQNNLTVDLGNGGAGLYFGSALDTYFYRSGAGSLTLNGKLTQSNAGGSVILDAGHVRIGGSAVGYGSNALVFDNTTGLPGNIAGGGTLYVNGGILYFRGANNIIAVAGP